MTKAVSRAVVLLMATALSGASLANAQTSPEESDVDKLRGRLERLERQNEELLSALQHLQSHIVKQEPPPVLLPPPAKLPDEPEPPPQANDSIETEARQPERRMPEADEETPAKPLTQKEIEKIISDLWKEKEEEQKQAEERKRTVEEFIVGDNLSLSANWGHGLVVESADKAFKVHVGGRVQFDPVWLTASDRVMFGPHGTGPAHDGFNFRRGRLEADGTFYEVIDFFAEWDFTNTFNSNPGIEPARETNVANTPVPTDLWAQISKIPVIGHVRVGNQKPQISFEHLTSSRWLNFLERSFNFDTFIGGLDNGFKPGIQVWNHAFNERMTWSIGVYKNNQSIFGWNVGGGEYDVTGRVTCLPVYMHEGRCLIHLGLGASHRDVDRDHYRVRARTLLRNGPAPLHTPLVDYVIDADRQTLIVPEFAMVMGPFSMAAEYFAVWFSDAALAGAPPGARGTIYYHGAYVEALYFLTGEHRPYNLYGGSGAAFGRVIPHRNFYFVRGEHGEHLWSPGAWQVGARYSWIDLQERGIPGSGVLHDVTLGLNWFLNPNLKFQWNYSIAHRSVEAAPSDGVVQGFGMRMAYDF